MARVPKWVYEGWPDPSPEVRSICEWVKDLQLPEDPPEVQRVRLKTRSSAKAGEFDVYSYRYLEVWEYYGELIVRFRLPNPDEDVISWDWYTSVKASDIERYRRQWEVVELAGKVVDAYSQFAKLVEELKELCREVPKERVELPVERW